MKRRNPEAAKPCKPVMGRLWWRADDLEELVSHVDRVAKAGGRILSIDPSPVDISYIFEIDKATADERLGYAVGEEEWLIDDDETEGSMDDLGKYDVIRYGSGFAVTDMQTHNWMHEKLIGDRAKAFRLARKLAKADASKRRADAAAADAAARAPKKKKARRK